MQQRGVHAPWNTGRFENIVKDGSRLRHLPWLVLLSMLAGTWQLWKSTERHALHARQVEFELRVQGAADRVRQRMQDYEQVLYGTRGFVINQQLVKHRAFSSYIESLQLAQRFPGIQGVSYAPLVPAQHRQAHIAAMRKDGLEDYTVQPTSASGQYVPVAYIEPHTPSNLRVLGFDNFGSPQRRASLEKARDQGQVVVSEKLTLMQEGGKSPQPGCLMFLPVYQPGAGNATQAERQASIAGWLAASFRMNDLMSALLAPDAGELGIQIHDGGEASEQALMFDSDAGGRASQARSPLFRTATRIEVGGRPWLISAHSLPAFEAGVDRSKAYLTAAAAFLLSIMLAGVTAVLVRDRSYAMKLAEGARSELRRNKEFQAALQESERRWQLALEAAGHGVWDWDMQTDAVSYSRLSMEIIGCSAGNCPASYAEWQKMIHPEDLPQVSAAFASHMAGHTPFFNTECRVAGKDAGWKWIISRAMVVERDGEGKPLRMLGTHTDISERKAAETALRLSEAKMQAIIDHAPVGIWLAGVDGRYHFLNKTFCDGIGVPEHEILAARRLSDVLGAEAAAACIQSDREALAKDAPHLSHETLTFADGKPHQLEIRKVRLQDHFGETIGVLGISVDVTEQREREEALRESEVRYREIFNDASYFVFTLDAASRITFAPPILAQVTGYGLEEIAGAHIGKILTPQSLEKAQRMIAMKLQGEASVTQYELDLLCRDGHITPIEVNTSLIYRQGKVAGVQGAGRDISERRGYEQALRESEEKYRGLFESAGDFAYSTDLDGNFVAISEMLLAATEFERGELKSISQILSPENLALARQKTAAKLDGRTLVTRYELQITAKRGRRIPVEIVSTLVYKDGKPIRVQGIGRDITERQQAEELLRRSERKYRELMEQAAEAIFVTDHDGRCCVDVNQAACNLLGYTREELLALDVATVLHPAQMPRKSVGFDAIKEGEATSWRRRLRRKDGSYVPVEISSSVLSDGQLQALVRDISEWIEREDALLEANTKAESASQTKSEFLANMSHEIRTPMNSVIGMARLALSREADARQADYLEKILMSGEHLLGIIDDILDFSKIEAGKIHIENSDFDLRGVLDNLASLLTGKAAAKGLGFVVEVDPALPGKVQGDPLRLRQILLNFADNAIKFTAHGTVKVSAQKLDDAETGCTVLFEVSDTGIGMNTVEMAMLFRPFQQTDGSITRKYGGTGLGLSISKRLVELMGGELGVESEPGRGSRFWFRVRLDEGQTDAAPVPKQVTERRDAQAAIRNARVLLAENNLFNQQVAREFLEIAGCIVHVANNGSEALDLLRNEHFDCILMDVQMPVMDGIEATRQIRSTQAFAGMPVIALTANALEEERQRCMEAGMNDFITKPVRPEMLYAVLAKWLSRLTLPLSMPERRSAAVSGLPRNAAIDFGVLADLVGGNREKMHQMAHKFMESARQDMDKVQAALNNHDLAELRALGHHIKSPAAMMGAAGLADLCRTLETNQEGLDRARELVSKMLEVLAEIDRRIQAHFA